MHQRGSIRERLGRGRRNLLTSGVSDGRNPWSLVSAAPADQPGASSPKSL